MIKNQNRDLYRAWTQILNAQHARWSQMCTHASLGPGRGEQTRRSPWKVQLTQLFDGYSEAF